MKVKKNSESELVVQNSEGNPCNLETALLNIRSFNKHAIDVGRNIRFLKKVTSFASQKHSFIQVQFPRK